MLDIETIKRVFAVSKSRAARVVGVGGVATFAAAGHDPR